MKKVSDGKATIHGQLALKATVHEPPSQEKVTSDGSMLILGTLSSCGSQAENNQNKRVPMVKINIRFCFMCHLDKREGDHLSHPLLLIQDLGRD